MAVWQRNWKRLASILIDESPEVSLMVDRRSGCIVDVRGNLATLGWDKAELQGADLSVLRPQKVKDRKMMALGPWLLERQGFFGEVVVGTSAGGTRYCAIRVSPIDDAAQEPLALLRLLDVTEQCQMNLEVRRAHRSLRQAFNDLRESQGRLAEARRAASLSLFAAGLAHELNNPLAISLSLLNSLAGYVGELKQASTSAEDIAEMRQITSEINDSLKRIEKLVLRIQELEKPIYRNSFDLARELAEKTRRESDLVFDAPASLKIESDREAIWRILAALVDNARAARNGTDSILVRLAADGDRVRLTVADKGAGMSAEIAERACDPFFTTRPPNQGLGLGLFLATRAAARLGGSLEVVSQESAGTQVTVLIPVTMPATSNSIGYESFRTRQG
jgi:PAS domain S-box-containing protein